MKNMTKKTLKQHRDGKQRRDGIIIVRLDDMRGDIDQAIEVTDAEWAILVLASGEDADTTEIDGSNIVGVAGETLLDALFDRVEVDRKATHIIWLP